MSFLTKPMGIAIVSILLRGAVVQAVTKQGVSFDQRYWELVQTMRYWQLADRVQPPTSKYLLFSNDAGATNNLRIGWEMTGVVARETGRTLVLPPAAPWYLLDFGVNIGGRSKYVFPEYKYVDVLHVGDSNSTTTKVEDFINLDQLRAHVPTLTWEEFHARTGLDFEAAKAQAAQVLVNQVGQSPVEKVKNFHRDNDNYCHTLEEFQAVSADLLYMDGGVLRQGFACGDWDNLGGPRRDDWRRSMHSESWALLTHGFIWHPDAFTIASKVIDHLGIFSYNALHGRYGDFQYTEAEQEPSQIFQQWPSLAESAKFVYVASDNPDKFKHVSHSGVQILMWDDLFDAQKAGAELSAHFTAEKAKYTPERWFKLMGPVEEIICTYSRLFVGTFHSSFSGHIQRMRVHVKAPNTERLFHTAPETPGVRRSLTGRRRHHYRMRLPSNRGDVFLDVHDATDSLSPVRGLPKARP